MLSQKLYTYIRYPEDRDPFSIHDLRLYGEGLG